jgi:hypothetical protein
MLRCAAQVVRALTLAARGPAGSRPWVQITHGREIVTSYTGQPRNYLIARLTAAASLGMVLDFLGGIR